MNPLQDFLIIFLLGVIVGVFFISPLILVFCKPRWKCQDECRHIKRIHWPEPKE